MKEYEKSILFDGEFHSEKDSLDTLERKFFRAKFLRRIFGRLKVKCNYS